MCLIDFDVKIYKQGYVTDWTEIQTSVFGAGVLFTSELNFVKRLQQELNESITVQCVNAWLSS